MLNLLPRRYGAGAFGICSGQGSGRSRCTWGIRYRPDVYTAPDPVLPSWWRLATPAGKVRLFSTAEAAQRALARLNLPYQVLSHYLNTARDMRGYEATMLASPFGGYAGRAQAIRSAGHADPFRLFAEAGPC